MELVRLFFYLLQLEDERRGQPRMSGFVGVIYLTRVLSGGGGETVELLFRRRFSSTETNVPERDEAEIRCGFLALTYFSSRCGAG